MGWGLVEEFDGDDVHAFLLRRGVRAQLHRQALEAFRCCYRPVVPHEYVNQL